MEVAQKFLRECPAQILDYIDKTIRTFWNYNATQLSKWTKLKDSPWDKAEALGPLDDREIRLFFTGYIAIINERGKA